MFKQSEFYHAGEDIADDGKTIIAVINRHYPGWASCWDKRVCTVSLKQVAIIIKRLNIHPELVELIEGIKIGLRLPKFT